jgi:hypothetical protein
VYGNTHSFSNDKNNNYIYRVAQSSNYVFLFSDSNGTEGSWVQRYASSNNIYYSVDTSNSGHIYLASGKKIFRSTDYGQTFNQFKVMNDNLLGIYKKPSSNLLYVLDLYNLYELNDTVLTIIKSLIPSDVDEELNPISDYQLYQNYPNTFNPSTIISYELPNASNVELKVYDVLGNEVAILVDEYKTAGGYNIEFRIKNAELSSGIYFYRITAGDFIQTRKMLLLK